MHSEHSGHAGIRYVYHHVTYTSYHITSDCSMRGERPIVHKILVTKFHRCHERFFLLPIAVAVHKRFSLLAIIKRHAPRDFFRVSVGFPGGCSNVAWHGMIQTR